MFPKEWEVYRFKDADLILEEVLAEEIEKYERYRGETGSRAVCRQLFFYTLFFAAAMLMWGFMPPNIRVAIVAVIAVPMLMYSVLKGKDSLKNNGCFVVPIFMLIYAIASSILYFALSSLLSASVSTFISIALTAICYIAFMLHEILHGRLRHLVSQAKANPTRNLAELVAEDGFSIEEEKPLGASRAQLAAIVAVSIVAGGFGINAGIGYQEEPEPVSTTVSTMPAETVHTSPEANYTWELGEEGYTLVNFDAGTEEVNPNIPSRIENTPVVAIGTQAFQDETSVTQVVIPDTVTQIGSYAFKGCTGLEHITMGDQVTDIGGEAFYGCSSLKSFTVPAGMTEIRGNTFQNCTALVSVELHENITAIHAYAFNNCTALESITLPSGITEIRANTFEDCSSLTAVEIPEGVTRIAAHAFRNCSSLNSAVVPETVREIGSSAFRNCKSLMQITIAEDCEVDERAFKDSPTTITYY